MVGERLLAFVSTRFQWIQLTQLRPWFLKATVAPWQPDHDPLSRLCDSGCGVSGCFGVRGGSKRLRRCSETSTYSALVKVLDGELELDISRDTLVSPW